MRPGQFAIVIPSCRKLDAELLASIPSEVPVYVVSDTDAPIKSVRPNMHIFDLPFQRSVMGTDYDLIPRRTSACRNFGFFYVWRYTAHECVISLDDDVQPRDGFLEAFAHLGERGQFETATGVSWFNTLDLFEGCDGLYPRGFPFPERLAAAPVWHTTTARAVCHMGLWDGVLDTHAIDKLLFPEYTEPRPALALRRSLVRIGTRPEPTRFPLCSMNLAIVRDALALLYQFPMPEEFVDRYSLGRYEDIWAGYVAQTLITARDEAVTAGAPVVRHAKEGAVHREIEGEHYGTLLSPYLFAVVDDAAEGVRSGPYLDMYAELADRILTHGLLARRPLAIPAPFRQYIERSFRAVSRWCDLHASSGNGRVRPARISGA